MKKMIFAIAIATGVMSASFANAQTADKNAPKPVTEKKMHASGKHNTNAAKPVNAATPASEQTTAAPAKKMTKMPKVKKSEAKVQ